MTEPTINLQKDLELWVDFDPDYYDAQRGQIKDRSGYGRHPEAGGGPTVGVEGPNDFQAASFDASDDQFVVPSTLATPNSYTFFGLAKLGSTTTTNNGIIGNDNGGAGGASIRHGNNSIILRHYDGGGDFIEARKDPVSTDTWLSLVGVWDGDEIRLYADGLLEESSAVSTHNTADQNAVIGVRQGTHWDGDISVAAQWSRALSESEVEHLTRLTSPRRAML